jgi:hypothetical protein
VAPQATLPKWKKNTASGTLGNLAPSFTKVWGYLMLLYDPWNWNFNRKLFPLGEVHTNRSKRRNLKGSSRMKFKRIFTYES